MNTFKKTGGFTLVELIIVIAILAILSSVAVAGYSSYITKANNSAVEQFMANVKTHATLANAEAGAVGEITFADGDTKDVLVTISKGTPGWAKNFVTDFQTAYGVTLTEVKSDGVVTAYTFEIDVDAWDNSEYAD